MIVQINAACRGEKERHNNNTLVPEAQGHGRAPRAPNPEVWDKNSPLCGEFYRQNVPAPGSVRR